MTRYILLDPQGGDGGGAPAPSVDPNEGFKALLSKTNNDALALAEKLYAENYKLRQKASALKSSVPDEGSLVLKGDDAKDWQKYREFGKPAEVKASLESGRLAQSKLEGIGRAETYRRAAKTLGVNEAVFALKAEHDGLAVEFVEGKGKDGKAVIQAVVKGEGDSTTPLNEYVDTHWSDLKPALGGPDSREKSRDATPPRRPFGAPAGDAPADRDEVVRKSLQSAGFYRAGL